ncbi:MAG: HAMP domain-containing sensor histidine kinase [bacterium]|nr:HAMP domain-containing sensor histidine kinase [bacterium]
MKNLLKQFGASGTASRSDLFAVARYKLTIYAIIAVALFLIAFPLLFNYRHDQLLIEHVVENYHDPATQEQLISEAKALRSKAEMEMQVAALLIMSVTAYIASGFVLKPIRQTMWARKRFTADAAHDMRTPLAIMKTELELALREKTPEPDMLVKTLRSNLEEVDRMTSMIEDLLALTRYDNVRYASQMPKNPVDIRRVVERVAGSMQQRALKKNVHISLRRHEVGTLLGDESAIERMVANVISNAITYTPSGGSITVDVERTEKRIIIRVADTGIGISAEDLPHIFERFYKAEKPTSYAHIKGSGLGLAIVKEIIEKHGGIAHIDSMLGAGTTVTLTMPISQ